MLAGDSDDHLRQLGQGWVAEEALAIAIYCALRGKSFEESVVLAVNITGDSDSTGSITGNLLGAIHGVEAIPQRWLESLELRKAITEMADDLLTWPQWPVSDIHLMIRQAFASGPIGSIAILGSDGGGDRAQPVSPPVGIIDI